MRVHLRASFGAVTQVRLCVCVNVALTCVSVRRSVCIRAFTCGSLHALNTGKVSVCSLCPTAVFTRVWSRV